MRLHIGFFLTIHFILIVGDFYHSWKITFASRRGIFHISGADIFKWMLPSTPVSILVYQFSYELGIFYGISACQFYSPLFLWTLKTLWGFFLCFFMSRTSTFCIERSSSTMILWKCYYLQPCMLYMNFTSILVQGMTPTTQNKITNRRFCIICEPAWSTDAIYNGFRWFYTLQWHFYLNSIKQYFFLLFSVMLISV